VTRLTKTVWETEGGGCGRKRGTSLGRWGNVINRDVEVALVYRRDNGKVEHAWLRRVNHTRNQVVT